MRNVSWKGGATSGLAIAAALSFKAGKTLPWKTVRDATGAALQARFLELAEESSPWPCDFPSAQFAKFKLASSGQVHGSADGMGRAGGLSPQVLVAKADLEPSQIQELGDIIPKLLEIKTKFNTPIRFQVRIEMGDGKSLPSADVTQKANDLLKDVKKGMTFG